MADASTVNTLIDAAPKMITALAAFGAMILGFLNWRSLREVKHSVDGAQQAIISLSHTNAEEAAGAKGELAGRDYAASERERLEDKKKNGHNGEQAWKAAAATPKTAVSKGASGTRSRIWTAEKEKLFGVTPLRWMPWISREHHEAVIAGKDEVILVLQSQNAVLNARLSEPINVKVELPPPNPASNQVEKQEEYRERKPRPLKEIDYSTLNENDPLQMATLAAEEFGGKLPAPVTLARWYNMVRMQCAYGRRKRQKQADQTGSVATLEVHELPVEAPVLPQQDPNVPQAILDAIAAAEGKPAPQRGQ
jgi:hypothetical protein